MERLPIRWFFGSSLDQIVEASGEIWKQRGEDPLPYLLEFLSLAQQRLHIVDIDPQSNLFGKNQIIKKLEEKLRMGVNFEIIHSGQELPSLTEAGRLRCWFPQKFHCFPLGSIHPRIEFMIADGLHTYLKEPDYLTKGIPNPAAIIRQNDQPWAREWEGKFQKVKAGLIYKPK